MRKNSLRLFANRYLKLDNQGNYKEKKQRAYVIQKMIDDLFRIGDVPCSWETLKPEHIHKLVKQWRRAHLKDATIMRHMTIIRAFLKDLKCSTEHMNNKSLGLQRQNKNTSFQNFQPDLWKSFKIDSARLMMALQTQFGLTFSESIQLKPKIHIKEEKLWITREIAFNSADRMIPIRNEVQTQILDELNKLTNELSLIQYFGYKNIRTQWRDSLEQNNLPTNKSWRFLYAKHIYDYLLPIWGNYHSYLILHEELGIKSRNTLWRYLHE
ncbi:TPA: integrase [Legionella pneumophila subsp. pneumophila]|nr:integrase [Legionella pneumophila subsp. pneumophila]